jgi:hypothetical protein
MPLFFLQVTIYLGKRDYVDHVSQVEPVGKLSLEEKLRLVFLSVIRLLVFH